ncbi:MAG TPA: GTP cyclohydrolase II RibA [Acidimicrobiales bacterium]|nr:GTP cyclohydrolase II RibA [Acidimicrobiales bacterium]
MARVGLPTSMGTFDVQAFECRSGFVYLALVHGDVAGKAGVLTRLHSECLTGDALGSLRCDCGVQLRLALRTIAAAPCGVLVYATGHEGRGIGLVEKLLAYVEQDKGADTLEANLRLGHAVDSRDYTDAAGVVCALGVQSVRLLTNNPKKVEGLEAAGMPVVGLASIATAPHARNLGYLRTKERSLGHLRPTGPPIGGDVVQAVDASQLLGTVAPRPDRPYVVLKYAQTLDGRIATSTGDARWISGESERRISHTLRAGCDAVLVGIGTVFADDPQLTVRMVPGASPIRVVLDSDLRVPAGAKVLDAETRTVIVTTERSSPEARRLLEERQVRVLVVPEGPGGVALAPALAVLRAEGISSLLVEGGSRVITSLLAGRFVDRMVVGVAPTIIGQGTEAVGPLGVSRVAEGIRLTNRCVHMMADDILLAFDVEPTLTV